MQNWLLNILFSWKTSGTAVVTAIALLLNTFHVYTLSTEQQIAIVTLATFLIGIFSKDASVSGTVEDNNPVEGNIGEDK